MVALFGAVLILAAVLVYNLPVGECTQCPHCQDDRRRRKEAQKRAQDDYLRRHGLIDDEDRDDKQGRAR